MHRCADHCGDVAHDATAILLLKRKHRISCQHPPSLFQQEDVWKPDIEQRERCLSAQGVELLKRKDVCVARLPCVSRPTSKCCLARRERKQLESGGAFYQRFTMSLPVRIDKRWRTVCSHTNCVAAVSATFVEHQARGIQRAVRCPTRSIREQEKTLLVDRPRFLARNGFGQ